ncbi:MAG: hypothetical protein M0030_04185 [Actinomycetota bacterium]|nr:hypothetical protein [Actinomycetota bacterium]
MAHEMGPAAELAMLVMMIFMGGGLSLALFSRAVPAAWRARIRRAIGRPASPAGTGTERSR